MAFPLEPAVSRPSSGIVSPPQRMPSRSRTQSLSSDRPSTVAHSLMSPPLSVSPEPAFIAASAASQIVTNDHDSHAEAWYDEHGIEPSGDPAAVSPAALQLVNSFLDQLLFNFLSVSRAASLSALRPAVSEVLKPKLAKDAINQADEELREYLGGDDEDSAQAQARDPLSPTDWDLELAWKRTRLRCMVYSSLGDMEEEDEDYYMEQGHLDAGPDDGLSELVSPAVAIFLTSILEFMGEQALIVAGQAAYHRMRSKYEKELKDGARSPTGVADRIVIEELDMERVALDRTLGRLWRSWKKKIRSPGIASMERLNRSYSRDSLRSASGHLRSTSSAAELAVPATVPEPHVETEQEKGDLQDQEETAQEPLEEHLIAAGIPLPMGPNDIAEIEVPGLALLSDDEAEDDGAEEDNARVRPRSLTILPRGNTNDPLTPQLSAPHLLRSRSSSLPAPGRTRRTSPANVQPGEPAAERSLHDLAETSEPAEAAPLESSKERQPTSNAADAEPAAVSGENVTEEDEIKDEDDEEVSIEEPRIVRSSRVSILGRSPSATSSENGKPAAINTNLPVRTPSIHSARLIEVASPRSPAVGSRRSSVVAADSVRHSSPSLASRTDTPPVPEDRPDQSVDSSSSGGRLTVHHMVKSGLAASASISETEEPADKDYAVSPLTPAAADASLPTVPEPVTKEQYENAEAAVHGSAPRPSTPPKPTARATPLPAPSSPMSTASTTSSTFFIESMPVLPEGREAPEHPPRTSSHSQRYRQSAAAQPPAVPEKSSGRQTVANTSALRQPATIGQVSVERSRARSPSQGSSSQPREQSAGRARQQGSPSSTKLKPVRTSEEGVQARIDVVRDFEKLIQSDETIQYTLTPESMRDLNSQSARSGAAVSVKTRKSEEVRQSASRSRSSSVPRSEAKAPAPAPRSSGSGSHPVADGQQANRSAPTATGKHGGVVPRSIPPVPSKPRASNGPLARDARLPRESLSELAEFIRSTGPVGGSAVATASSTPGSVRARGSVSNISIETGRMSTTSNPNRPRFQARGATVDYKDDNSDLIDFIRRGPPNGAGNPRIPRAVAPFRTTMDSDQLTSAVGGRAVDAQLRENEFRSSPASTHATESSVPPSIQSSINSHSALLARNKPMSYDTVDDDMPMPKRKTRRVRDPYAIDLSDEEELDEDDDELRPMPPSKKVQTQEESLIDFLNNYAPPPEPTVQPFNLTQTRNNNNAAKPPKKKASAPTLMARFTRRESAQQAGGATTPAASNRPSSPKVSHQPRSRATTTTTTGGGGGAKGGHVPIQVNIPGGVGVDVYAPPVRSSSKAAAMLGGGGPGPGLGPAGGGPRVPMKKFEPREAVSVPTSRTTSDLADFFKHSGPPPGATVMVNQFPGPGEREREEGGGGISRVFGRRRKPSVS